MSVLHRCTKATTQFQSAQCFDTVTFFTCTLSLCGHIFLPHCPPLPYRANKSTPAFPHPVLDRAALSLPQIPSTRWHRWCKCWRRLRTGGSQFPRDWSVYWPAPRTLWTARAPVRNLVGHRSGHWQTYWRWAIRKVTCDPLQRGTVDAEVILKSIDERVMAAVVKVRGNARERRSPTSYF